MALLRRIYGAWRRASVTARHRTAQRSGSGDIAIGA